MSRQRSNGNNEQSLKEIKEYPSINTERRIQSPKNSNNLTSIYNHKNTIPAQREKNGVEAACQNTQSNHHHTLACTIEGHRHNDTSNTTYLRPTVGIPAAKQLANSQIKIKSVKEITPTNINQTKNSPNQIKTEEISVRGSKLLKEKVED